jgi:Holliday junction resolvase RusA-like endonuclease
MSRIIQIEVPGDPVPKGRPRVAMRGRFAQIYTPKETVDYEKLVRSYAAVSMGGGALLEGPLLVTLTAHVPIPQSWSAKKKAAAVYPISRPDTDNFLKAALDALNGIVFADDSQVTDIIASKRYSGEPRLSIRVEPAPLLAIARAA